MARNVDDFVTNSEHAAIDHTGIPGVGGGGGGVDAQLNGGALTGTRPTLNFINGGATTISVVEDGGNNRINITISSTDTADLSTFETGSVLSTNSTAAGTFLISGAWPGSFTPHGLIVISGSSGGADAFMSFGFVKGTTAGITSQVYLQHDTTGGIGVTTASGSVFTSGPNSLTALTPSATQWQLQRAGPSGLSWSHVGYVLGRATS